MKMLKALNSACIYSLKHLRCVFSLRACFMWLSEHAWVLHVSLCFCTFVILGASSEVHYLNHKKPSECVATLKKGHYHTNYATGIVGENGRRKGNEGRIEHRTGAEKGRVIVI